MKRKPNMWPFGTNQPLGPRVSYGKRTRASSKSARPVSSKMAAQEAAAKRAAKLDDPGLEKKLKAWYAKGGNLNEFLQANPGARAWVARMRKSNPSADAAAVYEEFHGTPSTEIVEVTKKVHYHKHLAALGKLEVLVVAGSDGYEHRLVGFKGAKLCANESKNQMFIEGGDQALNASEWRFKKGWPHEMNSLGLVTRIEYFTTKKHLGSEGGTAIYFHESGKAERGQSAGVGPDLIYDAPNEALLFAGGTYLIKAEGIDK
jgi:hypothetical protein